MKKQSTQRIDRSPIKQKKSNTNSFLFGGVVLVCFVIVGFGGYYMGKQSSILQQSTTEQQNRVLPSSTPINTNPIVNENKITQSPTANCTSTFSSKHIKLAFKYDSCAWKISENLVTPEAGIYSTIMAQHSSNHEVIIKANTMGMGGGYPDCYQVSDISLLDNDMVRVQMIKSTQGESQKYYHYLNVKSDYAIKGYAGKFGDEKFKEYFTFLNPDAFPNTNMCWRSGGINPVLVQQPAVGQTESYQINKDVTVAIEEENISDEEFLKAADSLVVGIYSNITK